MNSFTIILRKSVQHIARAGWKSSRPWTSLVLLGCLLVTGLETSAPGAALTRRTFTIGPSNSGNANPAGPTGGAAGTGAIQAAKISSQSLVNLQAAMRTLIAQQAAQAAAQAAAQGGANHLTGTADVPDGISTAGAGGVVPDSGVSTNITGISIPANTGGVITSAVAANVITASAPGTITDAAGHVTSFTSGEELPALGAGSVITFSSPGALKAAAGDSFNMTLPTGTAYSYATSSGASTWINIGSLTQSVSNGETTVTTVQTGQYALLNWGTFNLGKNTTMVFDQSAGGSNAANWIALNKINDPNDRPSQILGSIQAQGQVYVINQSGIIFGGSSQINVHTLVASALDLNDTYATNPSESRFLTGQGILSTDGLTQPSFDNGIAGTAVEVAAGAQITASGGDVLLLAPTVENDGAINTPSGQALLVGGNDVLLSTGDSYIRGFVLDANQNAPNSNGGFNYSTTSGTAVNNGIVSAPQGNITIVGGTVTQNGVLTSTTSTTENGSILLDAQTGDLLLGGVNDNPLYSQYGITAAPSLVQILPDNSGNQAPITDSQAIANSSIALEGVNVDVRGMVQLRGFDTTNANNHDTLATSLYGTTGDIFGGLSLIATGSTDPSTGAAVTGNVYLENGSLLDTSGTTDATASASRNSVAVELRSNELADSPVVEGGPLYQQTIYVDSSVYGYNSDGSIAWQGTPLAHAGSSGADASGWIGLTTRSLDERLDNGAPITIEGGVVNPTTEVPPAPVNVVQAAASTIDISGGYMTYTPGFVQVSELITASGTEVDASSSAASPLLNYTGIAGAPVTSVISSKWGVSTTTTPTPTGYNDPGYLQGGNGGSLNIEGNTAALDGTLQATTVAGEKQRTVASAPIGTSLIFNSQNVAEEIAQGIPNVNEGLSIYSIYNANNITVSDAISASTAQQVAGFHRRHQSHEYPLRRFGESTHLLAQLGRDHGQSRGEQHDRSSRRK